MLPGRPEEHGTGSQKTGDLGCCVALTEAADEDELGQTGISDSRLIFYKEANLSKPKPNHFIMESSPI